MGRDTDRSIFFPIRDGPKVPLHMRYFKERLLLYNQ